MTRPPLILGVERQPFVPRVISRDPLVFDLTPANPPRPDECGGRGHGADDLGPQTSLGPSALSSRHGGEAS